MFSIQRLRIFVLLLLVLPPLPEKYALGGVIVSDVCPRDANFSFGCTFEQTCKGRCGFGMFYPSHIRRTACTCDDPCVRFGDCCPDFQEECPDVAQRAFQIPEDLVSSGKCRVAYHKKYYGRALNFLTKCPRSWTDDTTRELCSEETSNFLSLVPVTDMNSSLTYNNIYCAICNDLPMENLVMWKPTIVCKQSIGNFSQVEILEYVKAKTCREKYEWPENVTIDARMCTEVLIKDCHPNCTTPGLIEKCEEPRLRPFLDKNKNKMSQTYKNEFCALCSGVPPENLVCSPGVFGGGTIPVGRFSFALLADIDSVGCGGVKIKHIHETACKTAKRSSENDLAKLWDNDTRVCNGSEAAGICNRTYFSSEFWRNDYIFVESKYTEWLGILSLSCICASVICLGARLVLQHYVSSYHNLAGRTQCSFSASLLVALLAFLAGPLTTDVREVCTFLGMLMHWAFLATFHWMNVTAIDMWHVFKPSTVMGRSPRKQRVLFLSFASYAWLVPLAIVLSAYSLDLAEVDSQFRPYYGHGVCWIAQKYALILFFGAPLAGIILINSILYGITAYNLQRSLKMASVVRAEDKDDYGYRFGLFVKLFVLMGMTWVSAFVATIVGNNIMWAVYTVLTATQGVYVSLASICTKQVYRNLFTKKCQSTSAELQVTKKTSSSTITE